MPAILITIDPKSIQRHAKVEVADAKYDRGDDALNDMTDDEVPVTVAQYETMQRIVKWSLQSVPLPLSSIIFPDGLSVPDSNVIAQSGGHAHKFRPVKE